MNSFPRLLQYVWPHRRKFYLSVVFAVLVAALWGCCLSAAYPIITVLIENKKLDEYVDELIAKTKASIQKQELTLDRGEKELNHLDATKPRDSERERFKLLRQQSKDQSSLSTASYKLMLLVWLRANVVPKLPKDSFNLLAFVLAVQFVATMAKGLCEYVQENLIAQLVERSLMGVRRDCLRRVLKLDFQSVTLKGTPKLMAHFTNDMNVMASGLRLMGGKIVQEPLKAIVCIIGAMLVCWQLTLLSLLTAPVLAIVFARIGSSLKRASHRMMDSMTRLYKTLEETFDGYKVVTAYNAANRHRRRFHRDSKEYYERSVKIERLDALTGPITETMAWVAAYLALLPGCYLVLRHATSIWGIHLTSGPMSMADLGALYVLLAGVIDPARKLSSTYAKLKRAGAAADRIFNLMDEKTRIENPISPAQLPRHAVSIEFDNIHFAYARLGQNSPSRPAALEGVSLKVSAGEVVAVVGENGSGKSTLVNLLPRLYDPDFGSIRIDGIDIRQVQLADLRDQIAVVTQETVLFDDTIYENIRYGRSNASRAEIEDAATRSYVTRFFDQMPEGLETRVGEKGGRLSGGQRQRVALARAMVRNPAILILDEATSATDAQSERLIHEALLKFVEGRTTFLITHAVTPGVLELIDKVAVMDHGRLIAYGSHEQVLATCPVYERLFHARARRAPETAPEDLATTDGPSAVRIDASGPSPPPQILPLPLARGVRLAAQSSAPEQKRDGKDGRGLRDAS